MRTTVTDTPLEIALEQYARLDAYDIEGWKALVDPEVEFVNSFGTFHGAEQAGAVVGAFLAAFSGMKHEVTRTVTEGDVVAVQTWFVGVHSAPLMTPAGSELPATGRAVRVRLAHFLTIRHGRVATYDGYFDPADLMRQLGLA